MKIKRSGLYTIPGLGTVYVVRPKYMNRMPAQLTEEDYPKYLGLDKLPEPPNMRFVPVTELDPNRTYLDTKHRPFTFNYVVTQDFAPIQDLLTAFLETGPDVQRLQDFLNKYAGHRCFVSIRKPTKDNYIWGVIATVDENGETDRIMYDLPLELEGAETFITDGKKIPFEEAGDQEGFMWGTPAVISMAVANFDGIPHLLCNLQYRPVMIHQDTFIRGMWVLGPAGGMGDDLKKTTKEMAKIEVESEHGVFEESEPEIIGCNYSNRAKTGVPINNTVITLTGELGDRKPEKKDNEEVYSIQKPKFFVPLSHWIPGPDTILNSAVSALIRHLKVVPWYCPVVKK